MSKTIYARNSTAHTCSWLQANAVERQQKIQEKNEAENLVYQTEKSLREYGDKIGTEEKEKIQGAVKNLKDAIATEDTEKIKKAKEALNLAAQKIGEILAKEYQAKSGHQHSGGESAEKPGEESKEKPKGKKKDDDNVIDAEFEESK